MIEKINISIDENKHLESTSENLAAEKESQEPTESEPEDKDSEDCRDHCMHCGYHCIYLNKD